MATCYKEAILLRRYPTNEERSMSLFHIQDFIIYKGRRGTVRRELWTSKRKTKYVLASLGFRVLLASNHSTRVSPSPVPLYDPIVLDLKVFIHSVS